MRPTFFSGSARSCAVGVGGGGCADGSGLLELALLFLLELALEGVDGGGGSAAGEGDGLARGGGLGCRGRGQGVGGVAGGEFLLGRLGFLRLGEDLSVGLGVGELLGGLDGGAVGADDLHAEEVADGVFLEAEHHAFEHLEGLLLVGDEGVLLGVAAKADALLEVVHGEEVILPETVEDGEHDDALVVAHGGSAEDLLLDVVAGAEFFEDGFAELVAVELSGVDLGLEVGAEEVVELGEEGFGLPLVGVDLLGGRSRQGRWRGWWRCSPR